MVIESELQDEVFIYASLKGHRYIVPNVAIFGWETDMISLNKSNLLTEFEIKCSRSDFKADLKKFRHRHLSDPNRTRVTLQHLPSYFFYVTPRGLLKPKEIPEYAGLITLQRFCMARIEKRAPRLHKEVITEYQRQWLERSITHRYWRLRMKDRETLPTSLADSVSNIPAKHIPEK